MTVLARYVPPYLKPDCCGTPTARRRPCFLCGFTVCRFCVDDGLWGQAEPNLDTLPEAADPLMYEWCPGGRATNRAICSPCVTLIRIDKGLETSAYDCLISYMVKTWGLPPPPDSEINAGRYQRVRR
jgi:hypothetical protein